MGLGSDRLLPGVVCPNCGSNRLIPLVFDTRGDRADVREGSGVRTPDVKCLDCGIRFHRDPPSTSAPASVTDETRTYYVWYDDELEVARIDWPAGTSCDLNLVLSATAEVAAIADDRHLPLLVDMRQLAGMSRDGREHLAGATAGISAIALLTGSAVSRMIANFVLGGRRSQVPMRMFQSEAEAVRWLVEPALEDDVTSRALSLLSHLARGELSAHAETSGGADESADAIIVGLNMLAEELQANRDLLDRRVAMRTAELSTVNVRLRQESQRRLAIETELQVANERLQLSVEELERLNSGIFQITELGNLLQASETIEESYSVVARAGSAVFGGLSGIVYLFNRQRTMLESKAQWGEPASTETLRPTDCWALQRGAVHAVDASGAEPLCRHVTTQTGSSMCIPLVANSDTIGILYVTGHGLDGTSDGRDLGDDSRRLAVMFAEQIVLAVTNLQLRETLRVQALHDPLTDLYNRRFVEEWLDKETKRAERAGSPLGILMLDIDDFKVFNDTHGHEAGDRLLSEVADVLRQTVRSGDVVSRYGGEEFLILCPGTELSTAALRAEQLRSAVAEMQTGVTLSIGVAVYPGRGSDPVGVINAADAALYSAKRGGRNRVEIAPEAPPTE